MNFAKMAAIQLCTQLWLVCMVSDSEVDTEGFHKTVLCCFWAGIWKVRWKEMWTSQKYRNICINHQLHLPWCFTTKRYCKAKRETEAHYPPTHVHNFIEAGTLIPLMIFSPIVLCPTSVFCLEFCRIQAHTVSHLICVTVLSYSHWQSRQLLSCSAHFGVTPDILLCSVSLSDENVIPVPKHYI